MMMLMIERIRVREGSDDDNDDVSNGDDCDGDDIDGDGINDIDDNDYDDDDCNNIDDGGDINDSNEEIYHTQLINTIQRSNKLINTFTLVDNSLGNLKFIRYDFNSFI